MAKFSDVNLTANTSTAAGCATVWFGLKTVLKLAGWTVTRSSDGTTYNATGDQITTAGSGAGGLNNTGAWFAITDGVRHWCVQHNSASAVNSARVKYTPHAAGFAAGSPDATRVPSGTDEQVLVGSGTDAAPTYATWQAGSATARYHICAESVAVGGVKAFVLFMTSAGSASQVAGIVMQEPMAPGSYDATDGDPCVVLCGSVSTLATVSGWFAYGTGSQVWSTAITASAGVFSGTLGVDLGSGKDVNGYPFYTGTASAATRVKGVGSKQIVKGPARTYPATTNTATDAKAYLGSWGYMYPNNTVPST